MVSMLHSFQFFCWHISSIDSQTLPSLCACSNQVAKILRPVVLGIILCLSHGRTFSLIHGYSAPMEIYKHLDYHDDAGVGKTWFILLSFILLKLGKLCSCLHPWIKLVPQKCIIEVSAFANLMAILSCFFFFFFFGLFYRFCCLCWKWVAPLSFIFFHPFLCAWSSVDRWWLQRASSISIQSSYGWNCSCAMVFQQQEQGIRCTICNWNFLSLIFPVACTSLLHSA